MGRGVATDHTQQCAGHEETGRRCLLSHPKCVQLCTAPIPLLAGAATALALPVRRPVQSADAGREERHSLGRKAGVGMASTLPKVSSLWSLGHIERGQQGGYPVHFL